MSARVCLQEIAPADMRPACGVGGAQLSQSSHEVTCRACLAICSLSRDLIQAGMEIQQLKRMLQEAIVGWESNCGFIGKALSARLSCLRVAGGLKFAE